MLCPFWCLAAALTALRPTATLPPARMSLMTLDSVPCVQRSGPLVSHADWVPCVDEASGETFYYNEQTGQSQWAAPLTEPARSSSWHLVPVVGTHSPIQLHSGEEQIIGRFDMAEQDVYVSRAQCAVRVSADGSLQVTSLGKPPTLVRANGGLWAGVRKDEARMLADGTEICLTGKALSLLACQAVKQAFVLDSPRAVFRCLAENETGNGMGSGDVQYSEDGEWMWNGTEWIPAR